MEQEISPSNLYKKLRDIGARRQPPEPDEFEAVLSRAHQLLNGEPGEYRPHDDNGLPGGKLVLKPDLITVIVPDVHARLDLAPALLKYRLQHNAITEPESKGTELLDLLVQRAAQLVFLGDYVHAEARARDRWQKAFEEFSKGYKRHAHMGDEMRESLGTVEMLLELKLVLPDSVHMLKGNHENILNEHGRGNFPFRKFAQEGMMVTDYMNRFYGAELTQLFAEVEHSLPLLAVGPRFLVTHAEPSTLYNESEIINYRRHDHVVTGLTWTANDGAEAVAVSQMLDYYIDPELREGALHFGGHRPVSGKYNLRAGGEYVQIHNPGAQIAAIIPPDTVPDPENHVVVIGT